MKYIYDEGCNKRRKGEFCEAMIIGWLFDTGARINTSYRSRISCQHKLNQPQSAEMSYVENV